MIVRDPDLNGVGKIEWSTLDFIVRHNAPGSFVIDVVWDGRDDAPAALLQVPGYGVMVVANGKVIFSGPVTQPHVHYDEKGAHLQVAGTDDLGRLADRAARPQPASTAPPYDTQGYDAMFGPAETVLKHFVDVNAGPTAIPAMRIPQLRIEGDQARGTIIVEQGRWEALPELLDRIVGGANIGYTIVQERNWLTFKVYEPRDKSRVAVFGVELGNVDEYDWAIEKPSVNWSIVLGGGEGTARQVVEVTDDESIADWGAVVKTRDARDVDPNDPNAVTILTQRGQEELANGKAKVSFTANVRETSPLQWEALAVARQPAPERVRLKTHRLTNSTWPLHGLIHKLPGFKEVFDRGDIASFLKDGLRLEEVIREIHVHVDAAGFIVRPVVGSPTAGDPIAAFVEKMLAPVRDLQRRTQTLERTR